jgi:hypothetical protein
MLDIVEIERLAQQKRSIRKECYKKIYEMCERKIKQCVSLGQRQLFFSVPGYVVGYPAVDRDAAARWVSRQFRLGGFDTHVMGCEVYVSWACAYGSKNKREEEEVMDDDEVEYPSFVNLKKTADKYRHLVSKK